MSAQTPATARQRSLITVFGALLGSVPMITLVCWFVLAADGLGDFPAAWSLVAVAVVAGGAYAVSEFAGFRAPALPPGGDPAAIGQASFQRFVTSSYLRWAVCESVFMVGVALGFAVDSVWPVLLGAVLALPLLWWEAWPDQRNQARFAAALERGGARSYLQEYASGQL
jgi:hypothetical protein